MAQADSNRLIARLQRHGFRGESLRKAWAIVMRESGGNPRAFNGNTGTGDQSYGLAQINMLGDMGEARKRQYGLKSYDDLFDPDVNLRVMWEMSKRGTDFGAWAVGPNAYKGAPAAAKTKYEELYRQFPGAKDPVVPNASVKKTAPKPDAQQPAAGGVTPDRRGAALALMQAGRERRGERPSRLLAMLADAPVLERPAEEPAPTGPPQPKPSGQPVPQPGPGGKGGIRELFYDPLGAYDEGQWINPIGGHSDHVHASFGTPQAAIDAIRKAKQMGLRASENPYAEGSAAEAGVHTKTSYHYQNFPGTYEGGLAPTLGKGLDVSGDAKKMAAYFRWLKARYGL